jgi:aryl-alcohol dehydrogenase-like predicted oxidoreductase
MEIRNLGASGLRVSAIGLGCNNFGGRIDLEASRAAIHRALDLGITLFDTADVYGGQGGSETVLGKVFGPERKRIVLASKFGMAMDSSGERQGGSRRWIMTAVEDSLRRLNTDYIDLYQFHCPDPRTPIAETLRALDDLVRQGKIRYCGCSNLPAWQVVEAVWTARQLGLTQFVSCQDEYSLLVRGIEAELLPAMRAHGLGLLPFYPLAGGFLSGKYRPGVLPGADTRLGKVPNLAKRFLTEANWARIDALSAFAAARGKSLLELAFAWLLATQPVASVIAGATRPEQVEQNVAAGSWQLGAAERAEIDRLAAG